ncbi:hypothetical protein [Butyrivibrio sp. TB]|uniref:hypothetical protein n=1 Tax=Butyrivibrio sp. TB TaxID=1520809 RepID=UPI0008BC1ED7|nr:hypothetical protein [Butyrivibrio sp. TB]SEQ55108.1 hypothetical protein SAMN02910382_03396 [Butyrivibrio sp. TB]
MRRIAIYNMKEHIIRTLMALSIAITTFNTSTQKIISKAESNNQEIINSLYEQLVIEGKNEASFTGTDYNDHDEWVSYVDDIMTGLYAIDSKDTPFDGTALLGRGNLRYTKKGDQYKIIYRSAYDINEAQTVIQEIIKNELSDEIDDNSTNKEIMFEICDYIAGNYSYSKEIAEIESTDEEERPTFVDAYYGDHKVVCTGFANMAYLLATSLGINCLIISTDTHQFVAAQTGDNGEYTAYDLTKGKYASLTWFERTMQNTINGMYDITGSYEVKVNTNINYSYASSTEQYEQFWYYISNWKATSPDYYVDLITGSVIPFHLSIVILVIFVIRNSRGRKKHVKNHRKCVNGVRRVTL